MRKSLGRMLVLAAASSLALSAAAKAAITLDGTLDPSYGAPLAVQNNVSTIAANTGPNVGLYTQLAAGYGQISGGNLNLFLAGSVDLTDNGPGNQLVIAIDAGAPGGVSNLGGLAGQTIPGQPAVNNLSQTTFDTGFKPQTLMVFDFDGGRRYASANLATNGPFIDTTTGFNPTDPAAPTSPVGTVTSYTPAAPGGVPVSFSVNNALENLLVGSGAVGDPGFTGATTGFELQASLADLGYTGGPIGIEAFVTQGSNTAITNQVLGSLPSGTTFGPAPFDSFNFDFAGNYAGNQFFVIPATSAIPLPASAWMILLALPVVVWRCTRRTAAI